MLKGSLTLFRLAVLLFEIVCQSLQFPVKLHHLFSLDEKAGIPSSLLVFSEILHEVRHLQRKDTNGAEFLKKKSDPWLGDKMAHFGHEN